VIAYSIVTSKILRFGLLALLSVWLLLTLLGKGGFKHMLLLVAFGFFVIEALRIIRARQTGPT
jgi:hypothetical protein